MSVLREHQLSIIREATERSDSDWESTHNQTDVVFQDYAQTVDNAHVLRRSSNFSSETSYGEIVPPGKSALRTHGLGILHPSIYDKSLPSLPRSSIAKTTSARSAKQTESAGGSVAKSKSSRRSAPNSPVSIHSAMELESSRRASSRRLSDDYSATKPLFHTRTDSSEGVPFIPPIPSKSPSPSSSSTTTSVTSSTTRSSTSRSTGTHSDSSQATLRTVDDVLDEVTTSLALRTKLRAETIATSDHTKVGVCSPMSYNDNEHFTRILATKIHQAMTLQSTYLFALLPNTVGGPFDAPTTLAFCGAPQNIVTKAAIMAGLRFKTRLAEVQDAAGTWIGLLEPHPVEHESPQLTLNDEGVLWDIVRKAANPIDPAQPPPGSRSIDQLLNDARVRLDRLDPNEAFIEALEEGILVDIRPEVQRAEHGGIPGSVIIERNMLEWRFDPRSNGRLPIADRYNLRIIVFCQEGYASSLAAASLQDVGLWRATDIDGGFLKWKSEGLPTLKLDDPRSIRDL